MISHLSVNDLRSPLSTATDSDVRLVVPNDGRTVVVFDENVFGLAVANGVSEVFPGYTLVKADLVTFAGATDTQLSEAISRLRWRTIFITADSGDSFPTPSDRFSLVRFSNNNTSTDAKLSLLWRLARTEGFRSFEEWFDREIRIGMHSVYWIAHGKRSEVRSLYIADRNFVVAAGRK